MRLLSLERQVDAVAGQESGVESVPEGKGKVLEVGSADLAASDLAVGGEAPSALEKRGRDVGIDASRGKVEVAAVADFAGREEGEDRDLDVDDLHVSSISNLSGVRLNGDVGSGSQESVRSEGNLEVSASDVAGLSVVQ